MKGKNTDFGPIFLISARDAHFTFYYMGPLAIKELISNNKVHIDLTHNRRRRIIHLGCNTCSYP
jgi:hypothetical protein